jgi:hypothetical protein
MYTTLHAIYYSLRTRFVWICQICWHCVILVWPQGTYGLPKPASGCPANWQEGWIEQDLENSDPRSEFSVDLKLHMEATLTGGDIRRSFCIKTSTQITKSWPRGKLYNVPLWVWCFLVINQIQIGCECLTSNYVKYNGRLFDFENVLFRRWSGHRLCTLPRATKPARATQGRWHTSHVNPVAPAWSSYLRRSRACRILSVRPASKWLSTSMDCSSPRSSIFYTCFPRLQIYKRI